MTVDLFTRHFLGSFFLLIGVLFASRALGLHARTGFSHINQGVRWSRGWWNRQLFNGFRAAILGVCLVRMAYPIDPWLGLIPWLYQPPVLLTGVLLLLASFGWVSYVQAYLHTDWRSGVDEHHLPQLITTGPYGRTRNPLFLGIVTGQAGFFLALPGLFSLACLIVGVVVLGRQARVEETALARLYGQAYEDYRRRVPRWFSSPLP